MSSAVEEVGYDARMPARERDPEAAQQFGSALRTFRLLRRATRAQLALAAGLKPSYIGRLERGEREATIGVAARLARSLGMATWELVKAMEDERGR